jgi:hypothetical protein
MNQSTDRFEELGLLAAALCEGEITPEQAARLEQLASQSAEARQFFLHYLQLHGELYWEHAASIRASVPSACRAGFSPSDATAGDSRLESPATNHRPSSVRGRSPIVRWALIALAASLLLAVTWWTIPRSHRPAAPSSPAVATLTRAIGAEWQGRTLVEGASLAAGEKLQLGDGLLEMHFISGAKAIVQGPAILELQSPERAYLRQGNLTIRVEGPSKRFTVRMPGLEAADLGTEFGVSALPAGPSEVHVFAGKVQVRPEAGPLEGKWQLVSAGQAVRVPLATAGKLPAVERMAAEEYRFARTLPGPKAGSVAALRQLVDRHPRLIHHYTFEGLTPETQREDKRGSLHLIEAVMQAGRGGGDVLYRAPGLDATTRAFRPYRAAIDGNTNGVALQSENAFQPPPAMTVELLLNYSPPRGREQTPIACALATRANDRQCGFYLAAAEEGYLTQLFDGDAAWVEGRHSEAFLPDEWYYVVSTFAVESGKTRINTYLANLTRGERSLNWVVRDALAPGTPPASRLGIGKGFDWHVAHAYPWSGMLDEVAIYDTLLDRATIEMHLAALLPDKTQNAP